MEGRRGVAEYRKVVTNTFTLHYQVIGFFSKSAKQKDLYIHGHSSWDKARGLGTVNVPYASGVGGAMYHQYVPRAQGLWGEDARKRLEAAPKQMQPLILTS